MIVLIVGMFMIMGVIVMLMMLGVIVMLRIRQAMLSVVGVTIFGVQGFCVCLTFFQVLMRLSRLRRIEARVLDDLALDTVAIAAASRIAVARAAAVGAVFALLFGLAVGAFVRLDQRLAIGDRNLIIIGVNFAKGEKAVTVAAVFDEGGLQ